MCVWDEGFVCKGVCVHPVVYGKYWGCNRVRAISMQQGAISSLVSCTKETRQGVSNGSSRYIGDTRASNRVV